MTTPEYLLKDDPISRSKRSFYVICKTWFRTRKPGNCTVGGSVGRREGVLKKYSVELGLIHGEYRSIYMKCWEDCRKLGVI